ncbi:MAG: bifunctional phosphoribosyl-AMP cyclohydrolase/phosphoribosyl-ATP diphosphatase HisIE [Candidatus Marinimicrobia bacterium]|nr:bifunctional phosphoribosyl-AMP cyclohydrolase/phosphoribosyl-ATP diphosphatase HisIE [Candidatus Neomarinimicrobiota bacterium]MCF7850730.1 bifunctional phosphoribosyl-AMP cyclohydrolase/phosphoribosyl-ATP diphosphatase HisIE [Candidatus Neomarinimicrobiota bacterium]
MKIDSSNMDQLAWAKQNGLIPAIVQDQITGELLMQAYMNQQSLEQTLNTGLVTFFSRSRQQLWQKGEESGNVLECSEIWSDCDNDSLKVLANPTGPVCHKGTQTCWDGSLQPSLAFLTELESVIEGRKGASSDSSYTAKLFERGTKYIAQKVGEEGVETALAATASDEEELLNESADLLYHLLVLLRSRDLSLMAVVETLKARHS